ncbi:putative NRPS-like enzyme [Patellaria atrata CBS 101060]|uniref:NRPS-like enzyme n=1 Tax=Patellaria atrata CBS 101060 TaxID=1346257 RepID=A0A9P4VQ66_9PEZI|nr:putative NRPS-like enzyme [Patellaria atrata CBS 101060]
MSEAPAPRGDIPKVFQASSASANRLIHLIPDKLAKAVPDHVLFSYPKTAKPEDGFKDVSSKCFANAINRVCWYLTSVFGVPKNFNSVGYMGPTIKVGYKMVFVSPRNNLEGHLNVLKGSDCQIFLKAIGTNVDDILGKLSMRTAVIPELEELLDTTEVDIYPYTKTFEEARMDPCLVLHTTGSTGLPKPITWKVGILSTYEAWRTIPHVDGYVPTTEIYQQSRRAYTSMPLFHTSGLNAGITWALLLGVTLVYGAPHVVPNAAYADEMHKYAGVDVSMGAPSIYEELSRDPGSLERINRFHYVVASGAPLSQKAGALISKHTRIISNLGATETACLQRLAPSINDWAYFYWHPTHSGIEMRETVDGLYELFLVKDPKLGLYQGVFNTFPHIHEWSMNDLYSRHPDPTKHFLYMYKGRKDDVIVLSNGEKIAPALVEATLMSHPLIKGAMVVGRGKFQPAALIDLNVDPPKGQKERHQMVQKLQTVILEANEHAPAHGKLDQYHILFANPNKPMYYLGQGKIQRYKTHKVYEKDIENLYKSAEEASEQFGLSNLPVLDFTSKVSIIQWLHLLLAEVSSIKALDSEQDMFEAGLDSLQVIRMARELRFQARRAGLERSLSEELRQATIYAHPTLNQLAVYLLRQGQAKIIQNCQTKIIPDTETGKLVSESPIRVDEPLNPLDMESILQIYGKDLPRSTQQSSPSPTNNMTVALTGSTGSLGSYILDTLYEDPRVSRIICLNRNPNATERHRDISLKRGFSPISPKRVEFLHSDLSQPQLGLETSVYSRLLSTVTHIIHNQWPVNFNWTLASFEPYIRGVRNLIHFSYASTHKSFILFISSVSAVGAWKGHGYVPEEPIYDLNVASNMGYGQSKLISECMLDRAAAISGVRSACCRVGIVAGPVDKKLGMWNKHEYIPSIFISSAHLGLFPSTFPSRDRIDWLPVDKLSKILLEILISTCDEGKPKTSSTPDALTGPIPLAKRRLHHLTTNSTPNLTPTPSISSSPTTTPAASRSPSPPLSTPITETSETNPRPGTEMYHLINPTTTIWPFLVPSVLKNYSSGKTIRAVPIDDWVEALAHSAERYVDPERNPAVKLVDFYHEAAKQGRGARMLATGKAERASRTLGRVGSIIDGW